MNLKDFDFFLPEHLIAQEPASPRGSSKLLHVNNKGFIRDNKFSDILNLLHKGDVLVFNDTKVIPSLLKGKKGDNTSTSISIYLLKQIDDNKWQAISTDQSWNNNQEEISNLARGDKIYFDNNLAGQIQTINLIDKTFVIQFNLSGTILINYFYKIGQIPLPPYIEHYKNPSEADNVNYQTVYAEKAGAVAAPTAGLHFTDELLEKLKNIGVTIVHVTLHVSGGTFLPILTENINNHKMHSEIFELDQEACNIINYAKKEKRRIIAIGTTTLRVLESNTDKHGVLLPRNGETDIFIKPGFEFKIVDTLITNFHTPKSSLFVLVCAFSGFDNMHKAYTHAINNQYNFYSYGDACFLEKSSAIYP